MSKRDGDKMRGVRERERERESLTKSFHVS